MVNYTDEENDIIYQYIKEHLPLNEGHREMAANLSEIIPGKTVTTWKIGQTIKEWRESGGYEDYLYNKFYELQAKIEELGESDPQFYKEAYKGVIRLLEKYVIRRTKNEAKVEINASKDFIETVRSILHDKPPDDNESR